MKKEKICFDQSKWFFEKEVPYDTSRISIGIEIKKKLYAGRSPFQKIDFYDTYSFGRILTLDDIVQTSEQDEFIYHEMICQVPMFLHKNPKKVLIVGGGDGGSLEEILKHPIERVWMVEIDGKVVELCQKYLPSISKDAFKDKRAEVIIGDGQKLIKQYKNFFDVIILDLSDPDGPAKNLISTGFYQQVKKALRPGGIVSIQSGSLTCQPDLVKTIYQRIKKIFPSAEVRSAVVPTYEAGEYSFIIGAKADLKKIKLSDIEKKYKKLKLNLRYYYPEISFSTKVLPDYLRRHLSV
jgi:spermidine synthase